MKIAIISSGCRPVLDGVTVSLHQRLQKLGILGHRVLAICPDYEELSDMYPDFKKWSGNIFPNIEVTNLPSEPIAGVDFDRNYSRKASQVMDSYIRSFQPDIIHVDEPERISVGIWNAPGVSLAKRYDIPIVAMYHTNFVDMNLEEQGQSKVLQWIAPLIIRSVYNMYDFTLVTNSVTEERVKQLGVRNTLSGTFLGIDIESLKTSQVESRGSSTEEKLSLLDQAGFEGKVVLAFVCRLNPDKGWPFFLESFKQFAEDDPDWLANTALVIAGGGELHDNIEHQLNELNIPTLMLGQIPPEHVPSVLKRADVCVGGSQTDTLGRLMLECSAMSTPIVVPRAGGITSFIKNNSNGLVFELGSVRDFGKTLSSLVLDPELRKRLGVQGNRDVQEYDWDHVVSNLVNTWENIIENHGPTSGLKQGITEFWGTPNSTHQFCEPHYALTQFAAEPINALSSLVYISAALMAYRRIRGLKGNTVMLNIACLVLTFIGLGSLLFHLTMQYAMQLLDEVPMLLFMLSLLGWKVDKISSTKKGKSNVAIGYFSVCGWVMGLLSVYVVTGDYSVFLGCFSSLLAVDTAILWYMRLSGEWTHLRKSILAFGVAATLWVVEGKCCAAIPSVWIFHPFWHILTSYSAYHLVAFNASFLASKKAVGTLFLGSTPHKEWLKMTSHHSSAFLESGLLFRRRH